MKCFSLHKTAGVLVIIGGLNWGLVGIWDYNLVNALLYAWPTLERVVYILVGVAAVAAPLSLYCRACKLCK